MAITIRPTLPSDTEALERFYADLSEDSRHLRFFGGLRGISHIQSVSFCTPDHQHREGFVALASTEDGDQPLIVGHLCLEPVDERTAEVAIAVTDAFQRQGVGRRLMTAGIDWARSVGITRLTATMLAMNLPIRRLIGSLGLAMSARAEGLDAVGVSIDLSHPALVAA
jgi:acetyltransferase